MSRTAVLALVAAGLLTACGNPPPVTPAPPTTSSDAPAPTSSPAAGAHVLEIDVTGTAVLTSLVFTLDGNSGEEKEVALPWHKTVEVPRGTGRHEWRLAMKHSGGTLSATATTNGQLVTRTGGSGSPGSDNTATLTGSFSD
ncbi:hypothetical protein [Saccharothrix australiensis]|uniref:Uncharacterized protein n=1 Tax=Saccharothrix australiensis TaxID=2072 RepID=A0A495W3L1_9PSEU|nr:hypothetical protein [Saccharothrix australiensis]RKT56079.1 hypothetical protein C8E97_4768 [Saccharothrix australiensis]